MAGYLNKFQGIVSLYVNDLFIAKRRFRSKIQRQEIMKEWTDAFSLISTMATGMVYFKISHYETRYNPEIREAIEAKEATVAIKKRYFDKQRVQVPEEKKKTFIRPKAEYSNTQFNEYFEAVKNLD